MKIYTYIHILNKKVKAAALHTYTRGIEFTVSFSRGNNFK